MTNVDMLAVQAEALAKQLARSEVLPLRPQDHALLEGAQPFRFGPEDSRAGWSIGEGPLVLLVHGWGGRGTQLANLARTLAADGYRAVFFDAGGHGSSRPEPVGFDTFIRDVDALTRSLGGQVFAWIGHSAGGLGMMASRLLHGVRARHYVCISAPLFPYVPLETIEAKGLASAQVIERLKPILAAQFATDWARLEAGAMYAPSADSDLLLVYDLNDERVRHSDADHIGAAWPGAQIVKTASYGHNRILQSPELTSAIRTFLSRPE
jgi:pimeloyl-ACP methyl ester carboxylesterase